MMLVLLMLQFLPHHQLHRRGLSSLPEVTSYKAIQIRFLCFFGMPYLASLTDNFNSQKHHEDEVSNTQNTGSPDVRRVVLVLRRISILKFKYIIIQYTIQ